MVKVALWYGQSCALVGKSGALVGQSGALVGQSGALGHQSCNCHGCIAESVSGHTHLGAVV